VSAPAYDRMGIDYRQVRRADPRFEAALWGALGDPQSVVNIGAGAGSYEPTDRKVIAVEPSSVMIAQRPPGSARVIQGVAEALPLEDKSVDAAMGVFTMHHWQDVERGLAEVVRVTRRRAVFITLDIEVTAETWIARDYLPEMVERDRNDFPSMAHLAELLPNVTVDPLPVPRDCTDSFCVALWGRPEAHLDPRMRQGSSNWHRLTPEAVDRALAELRRDLDSGEWDRRYGHLRTAETLDVGLRLVRSELG
jgi:SAM-dependent methyltransferase